MLLQPYQRGHLWPLLYTTLLLLLLLCLTGATPLYPAAPSSHIQLSSDTFPYTNRLATFLAIDERANQLWHSKKIKLLKTTSSATIPELPVLQLFDRDGDRKGEEFAYMDKKHHESPEFGFYFDTDGDKRPDYIIYNGGPMFSKDFSRMFWLNYHWIDSNGDGKIDIMIYNTVRPKGDDLYDEGISAWIYDRDFDGVFDSAEYLGKEFQQNIEKKDGAFLVKIPGEDIRWEETRDMTFANNILKDVTALFK